MDILIGILVLVLGAAVATMGLRLWFWMLPLLGFMVGFFLGAIVVTGLFGDGILSTALGWIVGILVGIGFALISWLWWYTGAIIAAGAAGALLASGIFTSFGVDNEWVLLIVAIIGAAIFAFVALVLALPIYIVIVNTAVAGAAAVVSGVLLIFNQIDVSDLGQGQATAFIQDSLGWWLLWIVLAAIGIYVQLRGMTIVALPEERYVPANRTVTQ